MATTTISNDNNKNSNSFSCITQTELGFIDLQHLCNGGKHAFTNANFHQAIDIYGQVISQLQGSLICKIYLFRASAYEQLGNYHHALQDAQRAILADPTYADGYLCAGSLFVMQKQWAEAATFYQKGIERVSIDDARHMLLVQRKEQVAHEIAERNTRIMRILPYDIICEIMAKLSITDRIACAQTCKDWHAYMFDSPAMWQDIHHLDASLLDRIGSVASKHVRRLTLRGLRRNQDLLGRLVEFNWCHIESLSVSNSRINRPSWRQFLQINKQIKSIRLVDTQAGAEDTSETEGLLQDVFDFCNHITDLTYVHQLEDRRWYYNFYDRPYPTLQLADSLALTTLNIACHLMLTYLPRLLPRCPNLRHLAIDADKHEGEDTELFALVEQSCPRLHSFHYGNGLEEHTISPLDISNSTGVVSAIGGGGGTIPTTTVALHTRLRLKQLAYFPNVTHHVDHQLARLIEASSQTLEMFRLSMLMRPATQTLSNLATLGAPRMQHLELLDAPCNKHVVGKVIRACPSIRWITLDSITDETFDALMHLDHLQRLEASLDMESITVDKMRQFFASARSLRNVSLTASDHFTDAHLETICAHNKNIETLELGGCIAASISVKGVIHFAQHHADNVFQLTFSSTSVPMHDKVVALADMHNLRCLTLRGHGCMDVGKDTMTALFAQRRSRSTKLSVVLFRTRDDKPVVYTSDMSDDALDQVERKVQQPDILSRYSNMAWLGMLRET